ncbi:MAG: AMP-binding protein [Rivularia sp. (in: cyanobacteria)]
MKQSRLMLNEEQEMSYLEHQLLESSTQQYRDKREVSIVNLLQRRASQHPNRVAFTFLENGTSPTSLTYCQLDEKAKAIAAYLQAQLNIGERVLLVYPQSLDAITAFFGCLYAGVVAIPAPGLLTARLKRTLPRLEAIAADARASLVLTTAPLVANRDNNSFTFTARSIVRPLNGKPSLFLHYSLTNADIEQSIPHLAQLPWAATDKIPDCLANQWQEPDINGDTLAYLQYTSGSTSTPKGVMLDGNNLMGHLAELQQAGGYDSNSITVTWMHYFHDYGLVEGILTPIYNGTPCYLMSPMAFIKQPLRWLQAISRYRATHSQAPNFAYAYCLRRIAPEERATLDLSSWEAAGNGAEPINPEVIDQFSQAFASCGFRRRAFAPAYGLAEATLQVTTSRKGMEPVFYRHSAEALAQNRVVDSATGQQWVSSGRLLGNTQVAIVHPQTLTRCEPDEVGEIWVASAGVARGYWQRPEVSEETFGARLADMEEGPFLRTGDLGFVRDGELFVTGRLKDLIIIRGENYYPQDIEWLVEKSHPALRPGYGAAFSIKVDGVEQLVIAFEVERGASQNLDVEKVVSAIRSGVAEHYELPIYGVVLLKRGSIFKTSSGKIQRQVCRKAFLEGSLNSLAGWTIEDKVSSQPSDAPQNDAEVWLAEIWQQVLEIESVKRNDNFFELGGDFVKAAVVVTEIEKTFGLKIPLASLAEAKTIAQLARRIMQKNWDNLGSGSLVPIRPKGSKLPFFYIHGLGGLAGGGELVRYLDPERPLYALQPVGLDGEAAPHTCIKEMVDHYIREIQTVQPQGPYLLGGVCIGGNIDFEMAQQLKKQGQQVLLVTMADSLNPLITEENKIQRWTSWQYFGKEKVQKKLQEDGLSTNIIENILKVSEANLQVIINHLPKIYSGRVIYFSAAENRQHFGSTFDPMQPNSWNDWVKGGIEVVEVPGRHKNHHAEPHIRVYAEKLNACLNWAEQEA